MLYENECWISDIDTVLNVIPELDALSGKTVLITGAAGLVCSAVVDILFRYNDCHFSKIQIVVAGRWYDEMFKRFSYMLNREDISFVKYDASSNGNQLTVHADFIIHGASNASPDMIIKEPVETMTSNIVGLKYLLDYSKEQSSERLLYISSSEVYGAKEGEAPYREGQYGFIDILNPRNSYSVGKRAAETLCVSYAEEFGMESVIVRPGHIYGPTASPYDTRVSSAWAYSAARGEDIIMKSNGSQIRSYCYCLDCASAILKVLINGQNGQAYNISNPDSIISIKAMAEILAKVGAVQLKQVLATESEKRRFNPMENSSLESENLIGLGWRGCFDAETGLRHTVQILKEVCS